MSNEEFEPVPEALRLAAWCNEACFFKMTLGDFQAMGRELRRLHGIAQRTWCQTMDRPKSMCGCPDCGPSLIDLGPGLKNTPPVAQLAPQGVPDGWKLVPDKATHEMAKAGAAAARKHLQESGGQSPFVIWRAMLAAAPAAPQAEPQQPAQALLHAARAVVAMTHHEARNAKSPKLYCSADKLNPCWDNRPDDVAGKHWGGGEACPHCNLRAAIALAAEPVEQPAGEYPPLPLEDRCSRTGDITDAGMYTTAQMRAYVDADRAARAAPAQGYDWLTHFWEMARSHAQGDAGTLREPKDGSGWKVHWWSESMRLMLPDGYRIDSHQNYKNGTMQFTIKADAAIARQAGKDGA